MYNTFEPMFLTPAMSAITTLNTLRFVFPCITLPYLAPNHVCLHIVLPRKETLWIQQAMNINEHPGSNQTKPFPLRCFVLSAFLWCFFPETRIACIRAATSASLNGRPSSPIPNWWGNIFTLENVEPFRSPPLCMNGLESPPNAFDSKNSRSRVFTRLELFELDVDTESEGVWMVFEGMKVTASLPTLVVGARFFPATRPREIVRVSSLKSAGSIPGGEWQYKSFALT